MGEVNLFDIPELMPRARRLDFENRCRQLCEEETELNCEDLPSVSYAGATPTFRCADDLEAMFPNLEAELVQMLVADAPTPQAAMETLLKLSASMAEPGVPRVVFA